MFKLYRNFISLLLLFLLAFSSCEKEEAMPVYDDASVQSPVTDIYAATQQVLLVALEDATVRSFIKDQASERVTYDYEVIYGMVKDQPMKDGRTLEQVFFAAENELLAAGELKAAFVADLTNRAPLLSINVPHGIGNWNPAAFTPPVLLDPEENVVGGAIDALYPNGNRECILVALLPDHALITLQENERMIYHNGQYFLDKGLYMAIAPPVPAELTKMSPPEFDCFMLGDEEICVAHTGNGNNPPSNTGSGTCREEDEWDMGTYITAISMTNIGSFENFGRPELRLRVFGGLENIFLSSPEGQLITESIWNPDRNDVNNNNWDYGNDLIYFWFEDYGKLLTFRWDEEDGGDFEDIRFNFTISYMGQSFGADVNFPRARRDDYIGRTIVWKTACERQYNVGGALRFRMRF